MNLRRRVAAWASFTVAAIALLTITGIPTGPITAALAVVTLAAIIVLFFALGGFRRDEWIADRKLSDHLSSVDVDMDDRARGTASAENLWSPRGAYPRSAGGAPRVPNRAP